MMNKNVTINILRFIFLILLQVLALKNLNHYHIEVPYVYILFILMLPTRLPVFGLFSLSFLTGLTVDIFSNTQGLHASACVFLALSRIVLLKLMLNEDDDDVPYPSLRKTSFRWFLVYAFILTLLHHVFLFNMELFRIQDSLYTTFKAIITSFYTTCLIILSQFLFGGRASKPR